MQVKVFSKQGIRKAVPERKTILIAINDTSELTKSRNYITHDKYAGILWLYFDDIETEVPGVSFNEEHANQIIDVVTSHPDVDIYVHCMAGMSRSQAVAHFIARHFADAGMLHYIESRAPFKPRGNTLVDAILENAYTRGKTNQLFIILGGHHGRL